MSKRSASEAFSDTPSNHTLTTPNLAQHNAAHSAGDEASNSGRASSSAQSGSQGTESYIDSEASAPTLTIHDLDLLNITTVYQRDESSLPISITDLIKQWTSPPPDIATKVRSLYGEKADKETYHVLRAADSLMDCGVNLRQCIMDSLIYEGWPGRATEFPEVAKSLEPCWPITIPVPQWHNSETTERAISKVEMLEALKPDCVYGFHKTMFTPGELDPVRYDPPRSAGLRYIGPPYLPFTIVACKADSAFQEGVLEANLHAASAVQQLYMTLASGIPADDITSGMCCVLSVTFDRHSVELRIHWRQEREQRVMFPSYKIAGAILTEEHQLRPLRDVLFQHLYWALHTQIVWIKTAISNRLNEQHVVGRGM